MYQTINDGGGINGRKIDYKVEDDGYNPTKTVEVVKKLVLQDKVFAIVGGLGTPTHSKVVDYLNTEGVPDLLVSSGALAWDNPQKAPMTFGYQVDYTREGKIQGKYIKDNFAGKKIGYFTQNDDVGRDTQAGLDQFIKDQTVARQGYDSANTDVTPQLSALKAAGAEVVVCECIPAFTALSILAAAKIGYKPQFVVSSIGADPATLSGLLQDFAKRGGASVSSAAAAGRADRHRLPARRRADGRPVGRLLQGHPRQVHPEGAVHQHAVLRHGAGVHVRAGAEGRRAGPDAAEDRRRDELRAAQGAGPDAVRVLEGLALRVHRRVGVQDQPDTTTTVIQPPSVTDRGTGAITPYTGERATPDQVNLLGK